MFVALWSAPCTTDCRRSLSAKLQQGKVSGIYRPHLTRKNVEIAPSEVASIWPAPTTIAAKIAPSDKDYFESEIQDSWIHPLVEYIAKSRTLEGRQVVSANAMRLMFLIDWPEPFGLVLTEHGMRPPIVAYAWLIPGGDRRSNNRFTRHRRQRRLPPANAVKRLDAPRSRTRRKVFRTAIPVSVGWCQTTYSIYHAVRD